MTAIDADLDTTYADHKDTVADFYTTWKMGEMNWALNNIAAYVASKNA